MALTFRPVRKEDFKKAFHFAIVGMHFDRYLKNDILLNLYGRYFWYMELERASQVIAAYHGDELLGVLLADMKGEPKAYRSFGQSLYVRVVDFLHNTFVKDGVGPYDTANEEMLKKYSEESTPDGEICFLAVNPDRKIAGIGTLLLREFERREPGKRVFLYTDSNCTYQFYEHRGFARAQEREISLEFEEKRTVPLTCFLYSKEIPAVPEMV